ncbi:MAG: DUF4252 domain-containing protein [Bacteroidales bacterium]|nr:DUF4252 domain-containing protein [Bacteroidales bacterium]MBN2761527.1 DUF4252 domain-containing protein [Bacteroidales bacterium]
MQKILFPVLIFYCLSLSGQSKSIDSFRKAYKEDNNIFIYSSTLQMLNEEKNPEFSDLVKDIEEIRILNYNKENQPFKTEEFTDLKTRLTDENYQELMIISERGNKIFLYGREKREKMVGFVALIENAETFTIIDVVGGLDFKKFMELKNKLDTRL